MERIKLFEQFVNESTRSQIGIIDKNGKIKSTYVHYDGDLNGVGKTLKQHYDGKKINKLLSIDNGAGLSSLDKDIKGGSGHSWNKPKSGESVFYGRDRGEKAGRFLRGDSDNVSTYILDAGDKGGANYVYLYDERDGNWHYAKVGSDRELKKL